MENEFRMLNEVLKEKGKDLLDHVQSPHERIMATMPIMEIEPPKLTNKVIINIDLK